MAAGLSSTGGTISSSGSQPDKSNGSPSSSKSIRAGCAWTGRGGTSSVSGKPLEAVDEPKAVSSSTSLVKCGADAPESPKFDGSTMNEVALSVQAQLGGKTGRSAPPAACACRASASSMIAAASVAPLATAIARALRPARSRAAKSAPASMSSRHTAALLRAAAIIKGVSPASSRALGSSPRAMCNLTAVSAPAQIAILKSRWIEGGAWSDATLTPSAPSGADQVSLRVESAPGSGQARVGPGETSPSPPSSFPPSGLVLKTVHKLYRRPVALANTLDTAGAETANLARRIPTADSARSDLEPTQRDLRSSSWSRNPTHHLRPSSISAA